MRAAWLVLAFRTVPGKLAPVQSLRLSPLARSRYLLAVLSGLLLAASFPNAGIAGLAWVGPGLMLVAALGKTGGEAFRIGYVAGLAHYLGSLHWLLLIPYRWHSIPLGPAAGWLSLSAYLALYPAVWVWLVSRATARPKDAPAIGRDQLTASFSLPADRFGVLSRSWSGRALWALFGAALWVALEMVVARLFTGFPWNLLGVTQYQMTPLIQIASVTGVYGVSFLIVWTSLSLLSAALVVVLRPSGRSLWAAELILPMLAIAAAFHYGFRQLATAAPPQRTIKLTLVQPSIPQTLIWDNSRDLERFRDVLQLSEQALTNRPDVLIWPESAVPSLARWDTNIYPAITNLVRQHHVWLILGSDDLGRPAHPSTPDELEWYNASFLVNPEGEFTARYIKRTLVVFGEYIPLVRYLPFVKWFTPITGGFTPGEKPVSFDLTAPAARTSTLICFEDVFANVTREASRPDTDFLVNLTNDGWFGRSSAQRQQAAAALFRAVENRLPLVRCCNNGLTCWIDAYGRMREVFRDAKGTIYGAGSLTVDVPLLALGEPRTPTPYNLYGDRFGWACVAVSGLRFILPLARRVRRSKSAV